MLKVRQLSGRNGTKIHVCKYQSMVSNYDDTFLLGDRSHLEGFSISHLHIPGTLHFTCFYSVDLILPGGSFSVLSINFQRLSLETETLVLKILGKGISNLVFSVASHHLIPNWHQVVLCMIFSYWRHMNPILAIVHFKLMFFH